MQRLWAYLLERTRGTLVQRNIWKGKLTYCDQANNKMLLGFWYKTRWPQKGCLVTKRFSQCKETDYTDIYSLVVCFKTVRLMLGLATLKKWHITSLDIRNAYLYGKLDEEIYMEQSKGFISDTSIILRLYRGIYGLK